MQAFGHSQSASASYIEMDDVQSAGGNTSTSTSYQTEASISQSGTDTISSPSWTVFAGFIHPAVGAPTCTPTPTLTPAATPAYRFSGLGHTVLAPVPVTGDQPAYVYAKAAWSRLEVKLYNTAGESVLSFESHDPQNACLNAQALAPGIYFAIIEVTGSDGVVEKTTQKVVVVK